MSKLKILLCSEASYINSGYSNYGYQLMSRLYDKGEFELAEISCFGDLKKSPLLPWRSYVPPSGKETGFGEEIFNDVLINFKPDVVWSFRDPWIDNFIGNSPLKKYFYWIYMPTVDSIPLSSDWINTIKKADYVATYTEWANKYLYENYKNLNLIGHMPPGAPNELFMVNDKEKFKEENGINKDCFIIGSVMRNQKRKLIPDLLDAFEELLESSDENLRKKLFLFIHTTYPDLGWDIPRLISERPKISKKLLFTYKCYICENITISNFLGPLTKCNKCKKMSCAFPKTNDGVKKDKMFMVYNIIDLYVQYSCAEGFGMPLAEAASCGVPVAATNYGAMADIIEKLNGYPITVQRMFYEVETHRKFALPDNKSFVEICKNFFSLPKQVRNAKSKMTLDLCRSYFNYDITFEKLFTLLKSIRPKNLWNSNKKFIKLSTIDTSLSNENFVENFVSQIFFVNQEEVKSNLLKLINYGFKSKEEIYLELEKLCNSYNHYESLR